MNDLLPRVVIGGLIAVHLFLIAWALVGLAEYVSATVPWPRVSNPLFPKWVLLAQWLLILPTALAFVAGYAWSWPQMPLAVTFGYVCMAALCAYQTFTILENDGRFLAMAAEYCAYVGIALFLFRSDFVQTRLAGL